MTTRDASESKMDARRPRTMTIAAVLIAVLGLAASPLIAPAQGHAGADTFTIEARESGCSGSSFCFVPTEGNPQNATPGDQVTIIFENPSSNSQSHNFHVTTIDNADTANRDTSGDAAYASTGDVAPGEQEELTFLVPSGSEGIYWWCDIGGHEAQGMYLALDFTGGGADDGQNGSPFPTLGALVAVAGLALAVKRRG